VLTRRRDDGSLTVLIIGYVAVIVVLVVVGLDASKLFLAQRGLRSAVDAAAISAVQDVATGRLYTDGLRCGQLLPVSRSAATLAAERSVNGSRNDLRQTFSSVGRPVVTVHRDRVTVALSGVVSVPFARAVGWLLPGHRDGRFRVSETSSATSPVTGGAC
jgi:uncharacterized membrane protein